MKVKILASIFIIVILGVTVFLMQDKNKTKDIRVLAIEVFIESRQLYLAGNHLALLDYVETTNDPRELDDYKDRMGATLQEVKNRLNSADPKLIEKLNQRDIALGKMMDFVNREFLTEALKNPKLWRIEENKVTGSTDVLYNNEQILKDSGGNGHLTICLIGATKQKSGSWRALPIGAFSCE